MKRKTWEEDCLAYGPFDGDRDVNATTLRDGFVVTRKASECNTCAEALPAGTRVRALTEACEGQVVTTRFCPACCRAMASSWTDDGEAIEERYRLGFDRRRSPTPGAQEQETDHG